MPTEGVGIFTATTGEARNDSSQARSGAAASNRRLLYLCCSLAAVVLGDQVDQVLYDNFNDSHYADVWVETPLHGPNISRHLNRLLKQYKQQPFNLTLVLAVGDRHQYKWAAQRAKLKQLQIPSCVFGADTCSPMYLATTATLRNSRS